MSEESGTRVWAVSRGTYSDYSVLYVFEREDDATQYVESLNPQYDECRVEALRLFGSDEIPDTDAWFEERAYVMADGAVEGHSFTRYVEPSSGYGHRLSGWVSNTDWRLNLQYGSNHPKRLQVVATGPDEASVHKVYGERLFFAQEAVKTGAVGTDSQWGWTDRKETA